MGRGNAYCGGTFDRRRGTQAERSTGHVAGRRETLSLTQVIKDMIDRDGGRRPGLEHRGSSDFGGGGVN